jgi:DNA-binding response OmpR family regulator
MSTAHPRILVVDDEPTIRRQLERVYREAGYEVEGINDRNAGLDAAGSAALPYDLIVTNTRPRAGGTGMRRAS